jgi:aryl-alcohol dehydrogenase-like predicted oxidoreductase
MSFSGNYGEASDEDSLKVLAKAVELGCTFWDTAQVYGQGHNETLIGRFLSENPGAREKVFIGSKCGFTVCLPFLYIRIGRIRKLIDRKTSK